MLCSKKRTDDSQCPDRGDRYESPQSVQCRTKDRVRSPWVSDDEEVVKLNGHRNSMASAPAPRRVRCSERLICWYPYQMAKILENALVIYTDGSCYPKGRVGGFGMVFLHYDDVGNEIELDTYVALSLKGTTSQRMELEAAVTALRKAPSMPCFAEVHRVVIRTDSKYVEKYHYSALTHWRSNKWCNVNGKPVDNADLWRIFVREYNKIRKPIEIEWVKGMARGVRKTLTTRGSDTVATICRHFVL